MADAQVAVKIFKDYVPRTQTMVDSFGKFPVRLSWAWSIKIITWPSMTANLRLIDSKGVVLEEQFNPAKYLDIIAEYVEDWSYMKFPFYKSLGYPGGIYRAGPLARLNACTGITTPLANAELKNFKKLSKFGFVESSMYYHYARLIELIYCD